MKERTFEDQRISVPGTKIELRSDKSPGTIVLPYVSSEYDYTEPGPEYVCVRWTYTGESEYVRLSDIVVRTWEATPNDVWVWDTDTQTLKKM
jgi:hypothetical protein